MPPAAAQAAIAHAEERDALRAETERLAEASKRRGRGRGNPLTRSLSSSRSKTRIGLSAGQLTSAAEAPPQPAREVQGNVLSWLEQAEKQADGDGMLSPSQEQLLREAQEAALARKQAPSPPPGPASGSSVASKLLRRRLM